MARLLTRDLQRWHQLQLQRLSLARQAKDLKALLDPLEEKFLAHVQECGGRERAVISCGFRLAINEKRDSVAWKEEFIRVAGVEAAEKLIAAAGTKDVLVIEPPAPPAAA
jgi:hypothetical protein